MEISVVGGGYVGIITGACFAELGHTVHIIEVDRKKAELINSAVPPIFEHGLESLLLEHAGIRLTATTGYEPVSRSDLSFICVGTPAKPDGSPDLSMVEAASRSIGESLSGTDQDHTVVVKSTVPPGTTQGFVIPTVNEASGREDIGFAVNPEFLSEGRAISDFMEPGRIVIGSRENGHAVPVTRAYQPLQAPFYRTGLAAAEMIKYASGALLATRTSFANELGNVCKQLGVDVFEVMKGVGMDNRLSNYILNAGAGFGGPCTPKDLTALIHLAEGAGEDPVLLRSVAMVNRVQPLRMISLLEERLGSLKGKTVTVLGLAFRENTDDIRDSRAIPVIMELIRRQANIRAYDPMAMCAMKRVFPSITYCGTAAEALAGTDGCLVMTEWPEFGDLDTEFGVMRSRVIIEGRRILTCEGVEGICW
jgi:UDPglucose 6-dehydrogenase